MLGGLRGRGAEPGEQGGGAFVQVQAVVGVDAGQDGRTDQLVPELFRRPGVEQARAAQRGSGLRGLEVALAARMAAVVRSAPGPRIARLLSSSTAAGRCWSSQVNVVSESVCAPIRSTSSRFGDPGRPARRSDAS